MTKPGTGFDDFFDQQMNDPDLANAYHEARAQMNDFEFRAATDQDAPFIFSSVSKSYRSSPYVQDLDPDTYTKLITAYVQRMLLPPWTVTIAHPTGYDTEIAGYALHRHTDQGKPVLGYCYVKSAYRRMGIATQLLNDVTNGRTEVVAVLANPKTLSLARDKGYRVQLSPYLL